MTPVPKCCYKCFKLIGASKGWTSIHRSSTGFIDDCWCARC